MGGGLKAGLGKFQLGTEAKDDERLETRWFHVNSLFFFFFFISPERKVILSNESFHLSGTRRNIKYEVTCNLRVQAFVQGFERGASINIKRSKHEQTSC